MRPVELKNGVRVFDNDGDPGTERVRMWIDRDCFEGVVQAGV